MHAGAEGGHCAKGERPEVEILTHPKFTYHSR